MSIAININLHCKICNSSFKTLEVMDSPPHEGDLTLCPKCLTLYEFDKLEDGLMGVRMADPIKSRLFFWVNGKQVFREKLQKRAADPIRDIAEGFLNHLPKNFDSFDSFDEVLKAIPERHRKDLIDSFEFMRRDYEQSTGDRTGNNIKMVADKMKEIMYEKIIKSDPEIKIEITNQKPSTISEMEYEDGVEGFPETMQQFEEVEVRAMKGKSIGMYFKERMEALELTVDNLVNVSDIGTRQIKNLFNGKQLYIDLPPLGFAKIFCLLFEYQEDIVDALSNTEARFKTELIRAAITDNPDISIGEIFPQIKPALVEYDKKREIFLEAAAPSIRSLKDQNFARRTLNQIAKERRKEARKERLEAEKEGTEVAVDQYYQKLFAPTSTEDHLSEAKRIQDRVREHGTFAMYFRAAMDRERFGAPALEKRFQFRTTLTELLIRDELPPYEIPYKPFAQMAYSMKLQQIDMIPKLVNTFLFQELKKLKGKGNLQETIARLDNLNKREMKEWEGAKNKMENWIAKLRRELNIISHKVITQK